MKTILIYDTETTGLPLFKEPSDHPDQPYITQLAAELCIEETGEVLSSINFLIKPEGWTVSEEIAALTGITTEKCERFGFPIAAVLPLFMNMWKQSTVHRVAHNESFDMRIIRIAMMRDDNHKAHADDWKATKPAEPPPCGSADDLVALGEEIAALNQQIGALNAAGRAAEEARSKREALKTKAESVDQVEENLAFKRNELEVFLPQVEDIRQRASGTKRVGLVHDLAYAVKGMLNIAQDINDFTYVQASATLDRYEEQHGELQDTDTVDQDAKASLPEYERGLEVLQNVVKNLDRDLEAAKAAKAAYDALAPAEATTGGAGDLDALQTRLASAKANYDKTQAEIRAVEQYDAAVKAAAAKTEKAAAHHADIVAWLQIAAALAPDGIPGELLEEALQPINATLKLAATDTKWPCVAISKDMEVTAKGRAYALLSESEKWRVDAMIAQAIAKISGYKILMLDRMDVLDLKGRGELLGWLDMLADDGHIETALLFATLKAMPSGLPATMQAFWLADGSIQEFKAAA